jgi:hypothetical protein
LRLTNAVGLKIEVAIRLKIMNKITVKNNNLALYTVLPELVEGGHYVKKDTMNSVPSQ